MRYLMVLPILILFKIEREMLLRIARRQVPR